MEESLKKTIYNLENHLLQPEVRKSAKELEELLADDFLEYGSTGGVFNKEQILKTLLTGGKSKFTIYNFEIKELSDGLVLALYRVGKIVDSETSEVFSIRSSIWRKNPSRWQIVFHQGTCI